MIRCIFFLCISTASVLGQENIDLQKIDTYYDKGKDLYYEGEYDGAIKFLDSCLTLGYQVLPPDDKILVRAEQRMGNAARKNRQYSLAERHLLKALELAAKAYGEKSERVAGIYNDLGLVYSRKHLYAKSQAWYEKAMILDSEIFGPESLEVTFTRMNNAINFFDVGNYSKCLAEYFAVLSIYDKKLESDNENYNRTYLGMSNAFRKRGDVENALLYAQKALEIKLKNYRKDHPSVAKYYENVAKALVAIGKVDEAKNYFNKALEITKANGDKRDLGNFINDAARVFLATDNIEEALIEFRKAEKLLESYDDRVAITRYNISTCLYALGKKEEALELVKSLVNVEFKAERFLRLAKWSSDLGHDLEAKAYFSKGKALISEGDDLLAAEFNYVEAKLLYKEDIESSWALLNQSIQDLVEIRRNYSGSSSRDFINDELAGIFEFSVEVALERYRRDNRRIEDLFTVIEKAKAASFWDNLSEENAAFYGGVPPTMLDEIEILREGGFETQLALVEKLKELETSYPEYYKVKYTLDVPSLSEVQHSLQDKMVLMDYFVLDDVIINFVVSGGAIKVLTYKNSERIDFVEESNILDENVKRITIIPHGFIYYVAFDQISHPQQGNALLYHYAFSYQLNSEKMITINEKNSARSYLGFVPEWKGEEVAYGAFRNTLVPLPGAEEEVKKVSALFDGEVFQKEEASELNFYNTASKYDILHLATHAQVDAENELNSVLYLEQQGQQDGCLEMDEIMQSKLEASLVILSACETGAGGLQSGEGVMSLARAFQYAGSESVLMSLWRANDNSAFPIIYEFVKNCRRGMPKDLALQQSKIKYLENADPLLRSDFYWAGFMINGNLSPLKERSLIYWPFVIALLSGILIFLRFKRS